MRGKYFVTALLLVIVFILSGCTRSVKGRSDELRMYDWQSEFDNGNTVSLSFDGSDATLIIVNDDHTLDISGLCAIDNESFVIFDENSDTNFAFDYKLYGDRVELSADNGTISLKKLM